MQNVFSNRKITISVLNWNSAEESLRCVDSVLTQDSSGFTVQLLVIDNGSAGPDWKLLEHGAEIRGVTVFRQNNNLGFAGGHNLSLRRALGDGTDFVWLINSDAIVESGTLKQLIAVMDQDKTCGAVSPVIIGMHDAQHVDFCGAMHDWTNLDSTKPLIQDDALQLEKLRPFDMWVVGTAVLFRVGALNVVGLLDDRLFAYYEDDDICARLASAGWCSRLAVNTRIKHSCYAGVVTARPPYYFYLMQRNYFTFWLAHTPTRFRKLIKLRLLDRSLYKVNGLYHRGFKKIGDAALLGLADAVFKRSGPPELSRSVPIIIRLLRIIFNIQHRRALKKLDFEAGRTTGAD